MEFLNDPKFGGVSPNGCESNGNCDSCHNDSGCTGNASCDVSCPIGDVGCPPINLPCPGLDPVCI